MQETCYRKLINAYQGKQDGYIVFNKHKMRTTQLLKDVDSFALSLKSLGFKRGDTLTLFLPTCPQAIVAFYACSKLGLVANIVHPLMTMDQLEKNLKITKSKGLMFYDILVSDHRELEKFNQILINCSVADYTLFRKGLFKLYTKIKCKISNKAYKYKQLLRKVVGGGVSKSTKEMGQGDSVVTTMHSGGTSGSPKIVCLSNNALNELCDNLFEMYTKIHPVGKNEYSLVALPIFHAYGLGVSIHTCLCNHYNLILVPKFNAKKLNKYIKFYNVSFMAGVPVMFKKMMQERNFEGKHLKKLKDIWCGGDVVSETLIDQFNVLLKNHGSSGRLMRGYGLTEVASVCAVNTTADYCRNSCGKPIPNTSIEIWGGEDGMTQLEANHIGEIAVSSPSIMTCYEDGSGITEARGKKWIKTGDLGYLDEEGYLFVIERIKRTIKISAINVFPSEIEGVAQEHEFVREACAVPYYYNYKTYIRLFISLNNPNCNATLVANQVKKMIKEKLIKYATPREVIVLDNLPRTQMAKIDYKKLENM